MLELNLRPATLDDAEIVAALETARDPEDARDPQMLRYRWREGSVDQVSMRLVAARDGAALAYVGAGHRPWGATTTRFGFIRAILHSDDWSEPAYSYLVNAAEAWLRTEETAISVMHVGADFERELAALAVIGYKEARRIRDSELDLVASRERLLAAAARHRQQVMSKGVQLLTLDKDTDPDRIQKLYELMNAAEGDVPSTVPHNTPPFDVWKSMIFGNPGIREDRFWIAREGDTMVGVSMLEFPPGGGVPWTNLTGTSRQVRSRGIARALKYETVAQAIGLGYQRVRTSNDGENAPILHLNKEMGYQLVRPLIELHRKITS